MVADSLAAGKGHPADLYRPGADHLPGRGARPVEHADRRGPGAHRAGGGNPRGVGAVGNVIAHRAYSAVILGVVAAAVILAVLANFGWLS
jgi:hypothetical protein